MDDSNEDKLVGSKNNNPPGNAELLSDNHVNGSAASLVFLLFVELDEDNDDYGASTSLTANGSNATVASASALDRSVDGSNAPPASTTALGSLANGSNLSEEGDAMDAGSGGNKEAPIGNGATGDSSIPPMQQINLLFHLLVRR